MAGKKDHDRPASGAARTQGLFRTLGRYALSVIPATAASAKEFRFFGRVVMRSQASRQPAFVNVIG
jgi:hypothetical protein